MQRFFGKFGQLGRTNHDTRVVRALRIGVASALALGALAGAEATARACGGCFIQNESTVVTDHRMAFSITKQRTILWDQIRYQGDPAEFVWVLPVKDGAKVELSRDEWIASLDTMSQPVIQAPPMSGGGSGSGSGCGFGCSSSASSDSAYGASEPPVQVVSQQVVGPYETVILRSKSPNALKDWLTTHGYQVPASVQPTVDAYVREGFDFLAMRLQPGKGVRAMKPVRVVTPGADVGLPLRMVAAGVGAYVGLTLYVLAEGRYHPKNFPDATIDFKKLVWDYGTNSSNYQALSLDAMAQNNGRSWLTEYANLVATTKSKSATPTFGRPSQNLADLYYQNCYGPLPTFEPKADAGAELDASTLADAGDLDAGDLDGSTPVADGGTGTDDGGAFDPAPPAIDQTTCAAYDDLLKATNGMSGPLWVTRMRGNLPVAALADDLKLEATERQEAFSSIHQARDPNAASQATVSPMSPRGAGSWLVFGSTLAFLGYRLRRRSRAGK